MEEEKDVIVEPSTTEDVETESSTVESEEATSQEATQEQDQQVPYDRFKEVIDERNENESKIAYLEGQLASIQKPQPKDETDPYSGMDAQTEKFYRDMDKRTQKVITKALGEKEVEYRATIDALASQNAKIQEKIFHQEQADVQPGSKEEVEVANYIKMGMDPDKAAWAVMGAKRVESAKSTKKQQMQTKTQQKSQANLMSPGLPSNSGVPTGEKLEYRDDLDRRMKEAGM